MTEFAPLFVPGALRDAVSGRAWLGAMLEFESALARAEAVAGIVPDDAASSSRVAMWSTSDWLQARVRSHVSASESASDDLLPLSIRKKVPMPTPITPSPKAP